jgi:transcriptional regulator NrdR family protein
MAYVRFVSVFREFKTLDELEDSIAEQRAKMAARKDEQGDEVEINKKKK